MATTTNKQRVLHHLLNCANRSARSGDDSESRPVVEQFVYAICREGVTRDLANHAFRTLQEQYFDWNEVRVSSPRELAESLNCLPDAESRGQRLVDFLQEVFETTYSFDLESLQKKGVKQAAKQLSRYQASNEYTISSVVQHSLGGHAIPLDGASLRVLHRLELVEDRNDNLEAIGGSLEHHVPKAKAAAFCDMLSAIAYEYCTEDAPHCTSCPLLSQCPTGQENKNSSPPSHRTKPR